MWLTPSVRNHLLSHYSMGWKMWLNLPGIRSNHFHIEIIFLVACGRPQRLCQTFIIIFCILNKENLKQTVAGSELSSPVDQVMGKLEEFLKTSRVRGIHMNLCLLVRLRLHPIIQSSRAFCSINKRKINIDEIICLQKLQHNTCKAFHRGLLDPWLTVKNSCAFSGTNSEGKLILVGSDCYYRCFIQYVRIYLQKL